jgi:carboxyl-terminal processing protease
MTPRLNNTNFAPSNRSLMLVYSFVLTLVTCAAVNAEDVATTKVAVRPEVLHAPLTSPIAPPVTTPNYFGDQYQPNLFDGSPPIAPSEEETRQTEITARYQDSRMLGFLRSASLGQMTNLYLEASRMIDSRHVSPLSYEQRTRGSLTSLIEALHNPAFLQAAGVSANPAAVQTLQGELSQLMNSPARSANEALGVMQYAAELANRRLGVRREAVALEFFNGTLDSLDKYTAFVPTKTGNGPVGHAPELDTYNVAALEEHVVGIGVELKTHESGALIMGVIENGPAAQAGLTNGDLIVAINGRSVRGQSLSEIADQITGPAGSSVALGVERNGRQGSVNLTRRSVYVGSVSGAQMLDTTIGYVRLKQFSESSAEDLEKAMWTLYRGGMKTLVLDLRGNPGGLLTEAVQVSDLFLPGGRIVATRGRNADDNSVEQARYERTWNIPLVVLVDENSASASEIFAAAIQDNGRGVLVGRKSYGKGTVQTHFPLQTVAGELKLTTAKFYSPSGREMAGAGVTPDVASAKRHEPFAVAATADADIAAAVQVARTSTPAQLAANAGQRR